MSKHPLPKRRLLFVILAVGIPSIALVGLGIGLILQESQLAESRRTEAMEESLDLFASTLLETADLLRDDAAATVGLSTWSANTSAYDPAIVLIAGLVQDELKLPWQLNGSTERFNQRIHSGQFGRILLRAERLEFASGTASQAVAAYRTVVSAAQDTLQRTFALLSLARSLEKAGQDEEADAIRLDVLKTPTNYSDDFGVPLSLYAAQQLVQIQRHLETVSDVLIDQAQFPLYFSPQAAYLYRAIQDSLRTFSENTANPDQTRKLDAIEAYSQSTLLSIRLQEDFRTVYPRLISQTGEHGFTLHANDEWLLSISTDTSATEAYLVAIDVKKIVQQTMRNPEMAESGYVAQVLSSQSLPPNKWLGPHFQGIYAPLIPTPIDSEKQPITSRIAFIMLAMSIVIGLTILGFYLWWRDTRRELETAKLRSDFVSSVSHELKTPLTSIRMFAETLRFRGPPEEIRDDYLDTIINESSRLTRLLNNVLDFSQIDKDSKIYHFQPVALEQIITAALDTMEYPLRAENFEVEITMPDASVQVNGDPDALEQIVLNLLTNAMKFSIERPKIEVGLKKNAVSAEFWVKDSGIGIEENDLEHIFTDYYRAENALEIHAPGTGLGLSLVQHAVKAHNGTISVNSTPGMGSTFSVVLPLL